MGDMMALLKKKMGPDKILLGNNANQAIAKHVFPVIDASMFEHYNEKLLSKESYSRIGRTCCASPRRGRCRFFGSASNRTAARVENARPTGQNP